MKIKSLVAAVVAAGLAVSMAGCSKSSSTNAKAGGEITESTPGVITAYNVEPQTGIIPPMINETAGGKVVDLLFAGLVYYDEKGETQNEIAKSIDSKDGGKTWDVKLNDGWKFSDGTPITAKTFVDSWNWGADPKNKALSSEFYSPIEGFDSGKLTGLKVVNDGEFTIALTEADPEFNKRLGYSAFYPMHPDVFKDAEKYGQMPISDGPYKLEKWEHNTKMVLSPNPEYKGGRKPLNKGVIFKLYTSDDAAYNDLMANQVDVLDSIPATALTTFKKDLGDRAIAQPGAVWQAFAVPGYLPHFKFDEEGALRRAALSMSLNRKEITDTIFNGTRNPATDFIAPVIPGHQEKLDGGFVLDYNPAKAKEYWAKANAISPWSGKFQLAYNADASGHKAWVEAVCNQIKNTLGIDAEPRPYPTFKELRTDASDGKLTSALRNGWQADYPSAYNFLGPLYKKDAGSNDVRYYSPEFEKVLVQAVSAKDTAAANQTYKQAEEILIHDLPAIPLWDANALGGYSNKVKNVKFDWKTVPMYWLVEKN